MRIAHLIPASFDYFDDIRAEAFALVEAEHNLGAEVEAFTLQYGTPGRPRERAAVASRAPSRTFHGTVKLPDVLKALDEFDAVHVHCPFFGGLGKLVAWKLAHPQVPLIVSWYRPVEKSDLFSYLVAWYNTIYLPKLFRVAEAVTVMSLPQLPRGLARRIRLLVVADYSATFYGTDISKSLDGQVLGPEERLAVKCLILYQEFSAGPSPSNSRVT